MRSGLVEQRKPTAVFGDQPHLAAELLQFAEGH
jgi:hypothetical protein